MFLEDVDLCWRLRRLGWRVAYEPAGRVTHIWGRAGPASVPVIVDHHRAAYRYLDKWWPGPRRLALPAAAGFLALRVAATWRCGPRGRAPRRRVTG